MPAKHVNLGSRPGKLLELFYTMLEFTHLEYFTAR
jgi:hypothetical protein